MKGLLVRKINSEEEDLVNTLNTKIEVVAEVPVEKELTPFCQLMFNLHKTHLPVKTYE